jgi:hypothetical protein
MVWTWQVVTEGLPEEEDKAAGEGEEDGAPPKKRARKQEHKGGRGNERGGSKGKQIDEVVTKEVVEGDSADVFPGWESNAVEAEEHRGWVVEGEAFEAPTLRTDAKPAGGGWGDDDGYDFRQVFTSLRSRGGAMAARGGRGRGKAGRRSG